MATSVASAPQVGSPDSVYKIGKEVLRKAPSWIRKIYTKRLGKVEIIAADPKRLFDHNTLVGLSWKLAHMRISKELPDGAKYFEQTVYRDMRMNSFELLIANPRMGKDLGTVHGLVRWLVENNMTNYSVLVLTPNRYVAFSMYRYFDEAWIRVYKEMRDGLKNTSGFTRKEMADRVRIRLYLGGEDSCLLGKHSHYFRRDCYNCVIRREWEKVKQRRKSPLPPVPFMDPWSLKLSGYCPFLSAFDKNFWYKSIVILNYDALPLALSQIRRHRIKRVIIYIVEYFDFVRKMNGLIKKLECEKFSNGEAKKLCREYNILVDKMEHLIEEELRDRLGGEATSPRTIWKAIHEKGWHLDKKREKEFEETLDEAVEKLEKLANRVSEPLRGALRKTVFSASVHTFLYTSFGSQEHVFPFSSPYLDGKGIVLSPGNVLGKIVENLKKDGIDVVVIGTSVQVPAVKLSVRDELGFERNVIGVIVPPLKIINIRKLNVHRIVNYGKITFRVEELYNGGRYGEKIARVETKRLAQFLLEGLEGTKIVVLLNKKLTKALVDAFLHSGFTMKGGGDNELSLDELRAGVKGSVKIFGDMERGILDYVVVKIYLPSLKNEISEDELSEKIPEEWITWREIIVIPIHGRMSMGIDPPVMDADYIVVPYGLRRPPTKCLPLPGQAVPRLSVWNNGVDPELVVIKGKCVWVYDYFDFLSDLHDFSQILGRWMRAQNMVLLINPKYLGYLLNNEYFATPVQAHAWGVREIYAKINKYKSHPAIVDKEMLVNELKNMLEEARRVISEKKFVSRVETRIKYRRRLEGEF